MPVLMAALYRTRSSQYGLRKALPARVIKRLAKLAMLGGGKRNRAVKQERSRSRYRDY